jgi:hypothetical protein
MNTGKFTQPDMYVWWTKTQAEFDKVKKATKFSVPLKWIKPKMGTFE